MRWSSACHCVWRLGYVEFGKFENRQRSWHSKRDPSVTLIRWVPLPTKSSRGRFEFLKFPLCFPRSLQIANPSRGKRAPRNFGFPMISEFCEFLRIQIAISIYWVNHPSQTLTFWFRATARAHCSWLFVRLFRLKKSAKKTRALCPNNLAKKKGELWPIFKFRFLIYFLLLLYWKLQNAETVICFHF